MRRIAMAALAISLAGCSTLDSLGPSGSVEGTYSLVLLNGSRLPYTFSNGVTLVSDVLTLYGDGTYSDYSQYTSGAPRTEQGYYTENNGSLFFEPYSGSTYQGSITGRVLTEIVGGFEQRFEKQ
jgi:hypothetical protein